MNNSDTEEARCTIRKPRCKCFNMLTHFSRRSTRTRMCRWTSSTSRLFIAPPVVDRPPVLRPGGAEKLAPGCAAATAATSPRCAPAGGSARCGADFEEIPLPGDRPFPHLQPHAVTADFFRFARESYSGWCHSIRELGRTYAPDMVVLMGRDESIRIPLEQDEYFAGNVDTVNCTSGRKTASSLRSSC